ncbi:MAG: fibronectin type III domain-containing protein [Fidelibacterota bacterium]
MHLKHIIFSVMAVLMGFSCSHKNPLAGGEGDSTVSMEILFVENGSHLGSDGLGKVATITEVTVTVTGPDMSTVTEALTVDLENNRATGSVEVPKGDDRTFEVDGEDANGIVQFSGSATKNITKDTETVEIDVSWIPPDPADVTISNITSSTVNISWTATDASDFYFYRILLSTSPQLDVTDDQLGDDIYDRDATSWTISELTDNTTYYVAVIVVDTELWFTSGLQFGTQSSIVQSFTTAQSLLLSYDDDSMEYVVSTEGSGYGYFVFFTCPSYPCYIRGTGLYLQDTSDEDDNYRLVISTSENILDQVAPTIAGEDWVWFDMDLIWETRDQGTVAEDFIAGFQYTKDNGWPKIGMDDTSPSSGRSFRYNPSAGEFETRDYDLGIRMIVEIGGGGSTVVANQEVPTEIDKRFSIRPPTLLRHTKGPGVEHRIAAKRPVFGGSSNGSEAGHLFDSASTTGKPALDRN